MPSSWKCWFGFLIAAWVLILPGSFLWQQITQSGLGIPTWAKMASSLVLVVYATSRVLAADRIVRRFAIGIALGMGLGFAGDLAMARLLSGEALAVWLGMLFFGLGHAFYIGSVFALGRGYQLSKRSRYVACVVWFAASFSGWCQTAGHMPSRTFAIAALLYSSALAGTAAMTSWLAYEKRAFWRTGLGGALFLASDLVVGLSEFSPQVFAGLPATLPGDLIWLLYGPAQLCLVLSVATLAREAHSISDRGTDAT